MANSSEFNKTKSAGGPEAKASSPSGARSGAEGGSKSRGVEHPIPEDMALYGDTRMSLQHEALPRKMGPNYGYGAPAPSDQFRVDCGKGASGEC